MDIVARKSRFVDEAAFAVQLQPGGFVAVDTTASPMTADEVIESIVISNPGLPKSRIEELAMQKGLGRGQVRMALSVGKWEIKIDPRTRAMYYYPRRQNGAVQ